MVGRPVVVFLLQPKNQVSMSKIQTRCSADHFPNCNGLDLNSFADFDQVVGLLLSSNL